MPDLVERDFVADRPGIKFVADITSLHTWVGFIYLATVIDCYSKKVVGWSITDHMRAELNYRAVGDLPFGRRVGQRIQTWHAQNVNVEAKIVVLATYMGHVEVRNLYWYFSAVPELMNIISIRFEAFADSEAGVS